MLGGMFSGHTECAGEVIERNGQKLKLFYGMSSDTAMKKHAGGVAEYRYGCHMAYLGYACQSGYSYSVLLSFMGGARPSIIVQSTG